MHVCMHAHMDLCCLFMFLCHQYIDRVIYSIILLFFLLFYNRNLFDSGFIYFSSIMLPKSLRDTNAYSLAHSPWLIDDKRTTILYRNAILYAMVRVTGAGTGKAHLNKYRHSCKKGITTGYANRNALANVFIRTIRILGLRKIRTLLRR